MPEVTVWSTSTELPGTDKQRKSYFMTISDGESKLEVILHVGPDHLLVAEPYVAHEYDEWDEEDDYYYEDEFHFDDEDDELDTDAVGGMIEEAKE